MQLVQFTVSRERTCSFASNVALKYMLNVFLLLYMRFVRWFWILKYGSVGYLFASHKNCIFIFLFRLSCRVRD